jgi:membrane fusion protein (multidrug efflux system)
MANRTGIALAAGLLATGLAGCGRDGDPIPNAGGPPATQVVAAEAKAQPVSERLSLVGTVAANEMVEIRSETDGTIAEVLFHEGAHVRARDLLIRIDDSKLAAAVAEAEANFRLSRANHERSRQLYEDKLVSQQEFDQAAAVFQMNEAGLELKRQQLKDTRIHAPFEGVVSSRQVSPGQVISRNTTLTWLIDLDPVKIEFNVPERFLSQVQPDQTIEVTVAAYPGRPFRGRVFFVSPYVDPATRTALVKAETPNPKAELKPGMFANLDLILQVRERAVVIPETALVPSGDRLTVFVINDEQIIETRPVRVGVRLAGEVEIIEGLQAGERVVAEGVQKVRPGGRVKVAGTTGAAIPAFAQQGRTEAEKQGGKGEGERGGR